MRGQETDTAHCCYGYSLEFPMYYYYYAVVQKMSRWKALFNTQHLVQHDRKTET